MKKLKNYLPHLAFIVIVALLLAVLEAIPPKNTAQADLITILQSDNDRLKAENESIKKDNKDLLAQYDEMSSEYQLNTNDYVAQLDLLFSLIPQLPKEIRDLALCPGDTSFNEINPDGSLNAVCINIVGLYDYYGIPAPASTAPDSSGPSG